MKKTACFKWFIVAALLLIFLLQAAGSVSRKSVTIDEVPYIASGYLYLTHQDFRLNREHPPLIKEISALPLLFLDLAWPSDNDFDEENIFFEAIDAGYAFLFENRESPEKILFMARLPGILLGLVLGVFVFLWSDRLYGFGAGLLSLLLYCFSPNLLAHARFAANDFGLTVFLFLTLYFFYRFSVRPGFLNLAGTCLCGSFALLAKFSGLFLFPILFILMLIEFLLRKDAGDEEAALFFTRAQNLSQKVKKGLDHGVLFLILIGTWIVISGITYLSFDGILKYFTGLELTNIYHNPAIENFLLGSFSNAPFLHYYVVAYFLKTPIAGVLLAGFALTLFLFDLYKRKAMGRECYLLVPPLCILVLISLFSEKNLGIRYILPAYPFLLVFSGRVWRLAGKRRFVQVLVIIAAAWYGMSSLRAYPDYLAYFNEGIGKPYEGYRYLDDSNVDWGQELVHLKAYLEKENIENPYILPYMCEPERYGIAYRPFSYSDFFEAGPRTLVISTHLMNRMRSLYWLRYLEPDHVVGQSLLVYHLDGNIVKQARRIYFDKLAAHRKDWHLFFDAANFFADTGDPEKALSFYLEARALNPRISSVHHQLGKLYFKLGKYAEAEESFRKALKRNPHLEEPARYLESMAGRHP
jgi:predicted membrane-bound dolichyl-phosphate-mannose-protein mannosyltransferase